MERLPKGAYDRLVTDALHEFLSSHEIAELAETTKLRAPDTADRIALHVSGVIERALDAFPDEKRVEMGVQLARRLIERIVQDANADEFKNDSPHASADFLRSMRQRRPDGSIGSIDHPLIPLLDTALLTNAPG
jgi:hypothetical protein